MTFTLYCIATRIARFRIISNIKQTCGGGKIGGLITFYPILWSVWFKRQNSRSN